MHVLTPMKIPLGSFLVSSWSCQYLDIQRSPPWSQGPEPWLDSKSVDSRITNSNKPGKQLMTNSCCNSCRYRWSHSLDSLTWMAMGLKLAEGLPLENQSITANQSGNSESDRQTDRQVFDSQSPSDSCGHHCRVLGLIEGWWGNITSEAGGANTAAVALANY